MRIFSSINDLYDKPSTAKVYDLTPHRLSNSFLAAPANGVIAAPADWRPSFDKWFKETFSSASSNRPILVSFKTSYLQFPLTYDPASFVAQFGKMVRSRPDIRRLAATIIYAMDQAFPTLNYRPAHGLQRRKYFGANLLIQSQPALGSESIGVTALETQTRNILDSAQENHLSLLYLAVSSPQITATNSKKKQSQIDIDQHNTTLARQAALEDFTYRAHNLSMTVITQTSALSDPHFSNERDRLQQLPYELQELVDYEVLLRSSIFAGTFESTFSWSTAMRRHVVWQGGTWKAIPAYDDKERPESGAAVSTSNGRYVSSDKAFVDGPWHGEEFYGPKRYGLSVVYGPSKERNGAWAKALWP